MSVVPGDIVVYVGAGSNIDPERHLMLARDELSTRFGSLRTSSVYRTRAVGFDGADFLNMVIAFTTDELPAAVSAALETVHDLAGRRRDTDPFTDRRLDLDLLLYGDHVIREPGLELPRRDIRAYGFVLAPLAELAPELRHPESGETMRALRSRLDADQQPLDVFSFESLVA